MDNRGCVVIAISFLVLALVAALAGLHGPRVGMALLSLGLAVGFAEVELRHKRYRRERTSRQHAPRDDGTDPSSVRSH